jgi:hypothetical protein
MIALTKEQLELHLPASYTKCTQDIRWIAWQSMDLLMRFKKEEHKHYFEFKKKYTSLSVESIALIASLNVAYMLRRTVEHKYCSIENIDDLKTIEGYTVQKHNRVRKKPKWDWLLNHQGLIRSLLESGYSSYAMSDYIYEVHHQKISHTLIHQFIKQHKEL